jgi:hypothetical protein
MRDPEIIIAGRARRVPLLAPRQNRIVLPGILALGDELVARYDALCDIIFAALTRAQPQLDRDEFDDWPVATYELLDALPVVAKQSGFFAHKRNINSARMGTPTRGLPDWDAIIAQFCNFLPGTTPDYWEDALTAPRLEAMQEEWRKRPPLAVLAAGWTGYKPKSRDVETVEELMRLFPSGRLTVPQTLH